MSILVSQQQQQQQQQQQHVEYYPPPPPQAPSLYIQGTKLIQKYVIFSLGWPLLAMGALMTGRALPWRDWKDLYRLVQDATQYPINDVKRGASGGGGDNQDNDSTQNDTNYYDFYQNPTLLQQVYAQPSAQHYLRHRALEFQTREGYCAGATLRCVLKSFAGFPPQLLPSGMTVGPNNPEDFCRAVDAITWNPPSTSNIDKDNQETHKRFAAEIFRLDGNDDDDAVSYHTFMATLQSKLDDAHTRVALNYLRPALFGFSLPWYWWPIAPVSFFFGLFAGHFSVVLAVLENDIDNNGNNNHKEPLIAVFDVNHTYGGTYLVPARRLYAAIKAKDIATHKSRALLFVTEAATITTATHESS